MTFKLGDRVRETSTTTGTGPLTLAGAITGFATFDSVLDTGDATWYAIVLGSAWEVGLGTFTSPGTLARTSILASSSGGTAISFAAGDKDVFITTPAAALKWLEGFTSAGKALTSAEDAAAQRTALDISAANTPNAPAGNIAAETVQDAINELDAEKAGLALDNIFEGTANRFTGQSTGQYGRINFGGYGVPPLQAHGTPGTYAAMGVSISAASDGLIPFLLVGTGVIGSVAGNGSGGTAFNTTSDGRLKTNLEPITGALAAVMRLKSYFGHYIGFEHRPKSSMFVAHELQEVLPDLVTGEKDAVLDDDTIIPQQVDYSRAVVLLTAALQEANVLIKALEQRVTTLEGV